MFYYFISIAFSLGIPSLGLHVLWFRQIFFSDFFFLNFFILLPPQPSLNLGLAATNFHGWQAFIFGTGLLYVITYIEGNFRCPVTFRLILQKKMSKI